MNYKQAMDFLLLHCNAVYDFEESNTIAKIALEHILQLPYYKIRVLQDNLLDESQLKNIQETVIRIGKHEPIQYIVGNAYFFGLKFEVNENVLIPRSETEELVEWVLSSNLICSDSCTILDIGTGSGAIAVAIKYKQKNAQVFALDISEKALQTAQKNAAIHHTEITFLQSDILDEKTWKSLPKTDIIVSNPPYIPFSESKSLDKNVLHFEPHLALFTPDDNPLIFYISILNFAKTQKAKEVYFETHYKFHDDLKNYLIENSFRFDTKRDLQGNNRMMKIML